MPKSARGSGTPDQEHATRNRSRCRTGQHVVLVVAEAGSCTPFCEDPWRYVSAHALEDLFLGTTGVSYSSFDVGVYAAPLWGATGISYSVELGEVHAASYNGTLPRPGKAGSGRATGLRSMGLACTAMATRWCVSLQQHAPQVNNG